MDAFVWNERYLTGEAVVDKEHQELVRIINWVIESQANPGTESESDAVLTRLIQYAGVHFHHEEALMAASGCDPRFIATHREIHRDFARQVTKMREFPATGGDVNSLLRFLTSWLAHHILGMDQSMARQLRKIRAGVAPAEAYADEQKIVQDPTTASLLEAMNELFHLIAARNDALESQVAARTEALSQTNAQLMVEQGRLQQAMREVEITQRKLLESEHKRSEQTKRNLELFLAQIIDGDPVPTFVIDASHRITHWNKACQAISGSPASEMIGTDRQWACFYSERRPVLADLIVDGSIYEQFETYYSGQFRRSLVIDDAFEAERYFPNLGEGGRWLYFTAAPLRNTSGALIGAIETLQDVTERHRAEEALLAHQNQLERLVDERTGELAKANAKLAGEQAELTQLLGKIEEAQQQLLQSEKMAAIGQLAAGVAHEINNPVGFVNSNLGTLKTYIGNLFEVLDAYEKLELKGDTALLKAAMARADLDFLREDLPSLVKESQEGLDRVTRIVQDLKDFSRVDQTEHQPADLNKAMESTLNVVRNELKYKAEVVLELGDIPEVDCVPAQINQVFMNLLVNAAQAIEQTGRITIRSGTENGFVWFEVQDTGKGMPSEVRNRIFEPFFTTKPVGKGTGLGLSISYDIIVKRHNGRIDVTSEVGQGTTFRIWLPA